MPARPIVGAVSPDPAATEPLTFARRLARDTGAPIHAVAGYDITQWDLSATNSAHVDALRERALASLDAARAALADCDVTTHLHPCRTVAPALHAAAAELDAGVIVAGGSRRGALGRLVLGTTAESLVHGARCPVAVVPRGYIGEAPIERIGVELLDTPEGHDALRAATALARRRGCAGRRLHARRTVEWTRAGGPVVTPSHPTTEQARTALTAAAEAAAVPISIQVVHAPTLADGAIDTLTRGLDLLVCGSRGYGHVRGALLGGVSRHLIRAAACAVLVIPRDTEPAFAALLARAHVAAV